VADPALPADLKTAVEKLSTVSDVWVQALGSRTFGGYALLNDISGQPLLVLSVQTPRDISQQGRETVCFFLLAAAILASSLIVVSAGLVERVVLARLLRISQAIRQISQAGES